MRNWFVITGGPSAGKTTLIEALEACGLHVEHESARIVIDEGIAAGKTIEQIRADEGAFQDIVYKHKVEREKRLDPDELIFFDRGMQDTFAYLTLHGLPISPHLEDEMLAATYRKVFLLEPFGYKRDYARTESLEEQDQLFHLLHDVYIRSGVTVEIIPAFPTKEERITYFLSYLAEKDQVNIPQRNS